jgi:hypothetical protein
MLERGRGGTPELLRQVSALLNIPEEDESDAPPEPLGNWTGPPQPRADHLSVAIWQRPSASGDAVWVRMLSRDAFLIGAVDVAGHGPAVFPQAMYLRGLIDGTIRDLESAPRLDVVGEQLDAAVARADIEAAWFLAIVRRTRGPSGHGALYEAVARGYPAPLLLTGPPFKSVPSVVPDDAGRGVAVHPALLDEPFRLIVASDGMLQRLGAGDEAAGGRSLLAWQTGVLRDRPPGEHLGLTQPPSDDESLLVVRSIAWDQEYSLRVGHEEDRWRTKRELGLRVRSALGEAMEARALRFVSEAMSNAQEHAYGGDGPLSVRLQLSQSGVRIEIEDEGRGGEIREGAGLSLARKNGYVDLRRNFPSGLVVTFVA